VPWSKKNSHREEDLICLCAGCHQRADLEKWGDAVLREYKSKPWVLRKYDERTTVPSTDQVMVSLVLRINDFDKEHERLLLLALAAFLDISPSDISVHAVEPGSIKLTLSLPRKAAGKLVEAFNKRNAELLAFLQEVGEAQKLSFTGATKPGVSVQSTDLDADVLQKVRRIVEAVAGNDVSGIEEDAALPRDLNLDSLSLLEIAVDITYEFKLDIEEEEFAGARSLQDLVEIVQAHRQVEKNNVQIA
jgi:acyl carrier protein